MSTALQERLDRIYRHQRHIYDVSRAYYLLGRDRLIAGLDPPAGGKVLEVGCGTARNLIAAAQRYPWAEFHGIDLSAVMLATAGKALAQHGMADRIRLAHADAAAFDPEALFGLACFDRIFFSYALSMIPAWRKAITHSLSCLAPNGSLHIVDFGTGEALPRAANVLLRAWLARFHVTPRDGLQPYLDYLARSNSLGLRVEPRYRGYAVAAVLTRAA